MLVACVSLAVEYRVVFLLFKVLKIEGNLEKVCAYTAPTGMSLRTNQNSNRGSVGKRAATNKAALCFAPHKHNNECTMNTRTFLIKCLLCIQFYMFLRNLEQHALGQLEVLSDSLGDGVDLCLTRLSFSGIFAPSSTSSDNKTGNDKYPIDPVTPLGNITGSDQYPVVPPTLDGNHQYSKPNVATPTSWGRRARKDQSSPIPLDLNVLPTPAPLDPPTEKTRYPWFVSIDHPSGTIRCGGTLISPTLVLTAAHCLIDKSSGKLSRLTNVRIAPTNRTNGEKVPVYYISLHPEYDPDWEDTNDIGILTLRSASNTTSFCSLLRSHHFLALSGPRHAPYSYRVWMEEPQSIKSVEAEESPITYHGEVGRIL